MSEKAASVSDGEVYGTLADLRRCRVCGHDWKQHDPEDGKCDAGTLGDGQTGFGPCMCGRELSYQRARNAAIARRFLDA